MSDKKPNAIIIVANGNERIINLDTLSSLNITLLNDKLSLSYVEKIEETLPLGPLKQLAAPEDDRRGPTSQPADRKSSKGFKHGPVAMSDIPINTLAAIYREYREAVQKMKGTVVATHWSHKLNVNKSTLTVWMSQIKQVLNNRPSKYIPVKVKEVALLLGQTEQE